MFDIAWTEILLIAVVAILVVGPRDLPKMLRTLGNFLGQVRRMAGDFQRQFNDAIREAELDDVKRGIDSVRKANPVNQIKGELSPLRKAGEGVRKAIEDPSAPKAPTKAAGSAQGAAPQTRQATTDRPAAEAAKKSAPGKGASEAAGGAATTKAPSPASGGKSAKADSDAIG